MEISKLNRDLEDETLDEIARREISDSIKAKTKEFLDKAIKTKIDDTASREGYIAPDEDTVDFVLMYIPLENLYHFLLTSVIGSSKTPVIEYAFSRKVILVSPQTLMAYLETIRHSMKLFSRLKSKFLRIVILILDCPSGTVGGLIAIAKNPFSSRYFCR